MSRTAGIFRVFLPFIGLTVLFAQNGFAANVQWEVLPDRERVTVSLTQEEGFAGNVTRIGLQSLLLDLGVPTAGMGQEMAPENAKFFTMSEPRGKALGFFMKTAAFGFVVTRPDRNTVIINAYDDPAGERWTPSGTAGTAKASTAPDAAAPGPGPDAPDSNAVVLGAAGASPEDKPAAAVVAVDEGAMSRVKPAEERPKSSPENSVSIFRSKLNHGGIADWAKLQSREDDSASSGSAVAPGTSPDAAKAPETAQSAPSAGTETAAQAKDAGKTPAPAEPARAASAGHGAPAKPEGQEAAPPPSPEELIAEVRRAVQGGNYPDALEKVKPLLTMRELSTPQMEEVLHTYAEMQFMVNQNAFAEHFDDIASATIAAMNYNQDSPRNAVAYLRLGYLNLKVDNIIEAGAYFNKLRELYPMDENIALTYYYWGQYYYDHNEMQKAADQYQYIITNFSENRIARDATLGLTRCYAALGYYQEAYDILDYLDKRWPRLYLEAPAVLELMGDVGYRLGNLDYALDRYMTSYNLLPSGPSADVILTRIGDVYALRRNLRAAETSYREAERLFPDKDGGLVAMMRLAEVGINDNPQVQVMMNVFQGPSNFKTADVYKKIITNHSQSELVPLAMLKLAMWYYVNRYYEDTLKQCSELVKLYPKHELVPHAEELSMMAFSAQAASDTLQNRPDKLVASWADNPIVKKQEESLSPESRVALASSMWQQNDPDGALQMINPLFLGSKDPVNAESALYIALDIDKEFERWDDIRKLSEQIGLWELTPQAKTRLDYALALANENLGDSEQAAPLWSRLAEGGMLSDQEQAYAEYFLARNAEVNRRLRDAYYLSKSSLNRFLQLSQQDTAKTDSGKINSLLSSLMDVCETSGRYAEALEYATQFLATLPPQDEQRQGVLFRIAGIYKKQGNLEEWRKNLTDLSAQFPNSVYGRSAASQLNSAKLANDAAQFSPSGQL
ncbi:hypothetical protein FACS1894206_01690 [Deltaproteobacteria bacterium]|nr:hypothetical protein FACS1894206_01690 [Deltaproteobacteria bacterium]